LAEAGLRALGALAPAARRRPAALAALRHAQRGADPSQRAAARWLAWRWRGAAR
jgi:hypothetical protein